MAELTADRQVSTGSGTSAEEVGRAVFERLSGWSPDQPPAEDELWPAYWDLDRIESIEADGSVFVGEAGLRRKAEWWDGQFEIVRYAVEGPFVGGSGFSLMFDLDAKHKASGEVTSMKEVGVYTVKDGKIVREEFMPLVG